MKLKASIILQSSFHKKDDYKRQFLTSSLYSLQSLPSVASFYSDSYVEYLWSNSGTMRFVVTDLHQTLRMNGFYLDANNRNNENNQKNGKSQHKLTQLVLHRLPGFSMNGWNGSSECGANNELLSETKTEEITESIKSTESNNKLIEENKRLNEKLKFKDKRIEKLKLQEKALRDKLKEYEMRYSNEYLSNYSGHGGYGGSGHDYDDDDDEEYYFLKISCPGLAKQFEQFLIHQLTNYKYIDLQSNGIDSFIVKVDNQQTLHFIYNDIKGKMYNDYELNAEFM